MATSLRRNVFAGVWLAVVGLFLWIRDAGRLSWLGMAMMVGGITFAAYQLLTKLR